MVEPPDTPVNSPVDGSIVATAGVPLLHVPPVISADKVVVDPRDTLDAPVIVGAAFTVI